MELVRDDGEPTPLGYILTGVIVVILIIVGLWLLWSAFFGWLWLRILFWSIITILAVIGAFYGVGKLFYWFKDEFI